MRKGALVVPSLVAQGSVFIRVEANDRCGTWGDDDGPSYESWLLQHEIDEFVFADGLSAFSVRHRTGTAPRKEVVDAGERGEMLQFFPTEKVIEKVPFLDLDAVGIEYLLGISAR